MARKTYEEENEPVRKSKSELKREMHALQATGEKICDLTPEVIKRLSIPQNIIDAALESKTIKAHEARRRHMQYIGRLIRESKDQETIIAAVEGLDDRHNANTKEFHRIETWRDKLISGDLDIIEAVVEECPKADRQHLRQLARNAAKEIEKNKPPKSSRLLFRYLRELTQGA